MPESEPAPPKLRKMTRAEYDARRAAPVDGGIVVARGVTKVYESGDITVPALRGVDLSVKKGEMVAIMGPSGCGKTTLLNVLSGIDDMTAGEVWIAVSPLSEMSDNAKTDFRAMRMGFIFQSYNLLPVLRAVENVELPLLVRGDEPKPARKKALAALEAVGLAGKEMKKPAELSGGEQQRVAIARSLVNEPDIVFADEPTGNLDSETTAEVIQLMKKLHREKGLTFVIVTHDGTVGNATERVVLMRNGVITKSFQPTGA
jgi:putative ABC transport system ATP-binding protein